MWPHSLARGFSSVIVALIVCFSKLPTTYAIVRMMDAVDGAGASDEFDPLLYNVDQVLSMLHAVANDTSRVQGRHFPMKHGTRRMMNTGAADDDRLSIGWYGPFDDDIPMGFPPDVPAAVRSQLLPAVDSLLARSVRVRRPAPPPEQKRVRYGVLYRAADDSIGVEPLPEDEPGIEILQLQDILLTAYLYPVSDERCQGSVIASAGSFIVEMDTLRPVYGLVNLCPSLFGTDDEPRPQNQRIEVMVHEVLHTLGFSRTFFPFFPSEGGAGPILWENGVAYVATKMVSKYVQQHFACPDMIGAALEGRGGAGTAGSHWENRLYHGVLMQGSSKGSGHVNRAVITDLTLALLQDSGWYDVVYNSAGYDPYGYKSGCALPLGTYDEALADPESAQYVCEPQDECDIQKGRDICRLAGTVADGEYGTYGGYAEDPYECLLSFVAACPATCVSDFSGAGPCVNAANNATDQFLKAEKWLDFNDQAVDCQATQGERCFQGRAGGPPQCANMSCGEAGELLKNGEPCDYDGCPDEHMMCGQPGLLTCQGDNLNDCNGRGDCYQGTCFCHVGYGGPDCSLEVCLGTCEDGTPCPPSGFCGVDACGGFSVGSDGMGTPCYSDGFL